MKVQTQRTANPYVCLNPKFSLQTIGIQDFSWTSKCKSGWLSLVLILALNQGYVYVVAINVDIQESNNDGDQSMITMKT